MTSSVLHGSVLGPVLFYISIYWYRWWGRGKIDKFSVDRKLGKVADTPKIHTLIQRDLNKLENPDKRKSWNPIRTLKSCTSEEHPQAWIYKLGATQVKSSFVRKALSDWEDVWLNRCHQGALAAKKSNDILGAFNKVLPGVLAGDLSLFSELVRPLLGSSTQFWTPQKESIVHQSATKTTKTQQHLPYEKRLRHLELFSLESRIIRCKYVKRGSKGDRLFSGTHPQNQGQ